MRMSDPALVDLLAQRYVIGTMRGAARRRFEAYAQAHFAVRRAVDAWNDRLSPLAWTLPPVQPSDLLWPRISGALGFGGGASRAPAAGRWAALAAALGVVALVGVGGWWQAANRPPVTVTDTVIQRVPEAVSVALVSDDKGEAIWLTSLRPQSRQVAVRVVNPPQAESQRDYQLWLLGPDGVPISLGLLPQQGEQSLRMSAAAVAALADSELVAVSLEPLGGSPEPVPTGPVLFTAALLSP